MDYSNYLGPDYQDLYVKPKKVPTYVSNHASAFDIFAAMIAFKSHISFLARIETKDFPLLGYYTQGMGGLFIDRQGSKE